MQNHNSSFPFLRGLHNIGEEAESSDQYLQKLFGISLSRATYKDYLPEEMSEVLANLFYLLYSEFTIMKLNYPPKECDKQAVMSRIQERSMIIMEILTQKNFSIEYKIQDIEVSGQPINETIIHYFFRLFRENFYFQNTILFIICCRLLYNVAATSVRSKEQCLAINLALLNIETRRNNNRKYYNTAQPDFITNVILADQQLVLCANKYSEYEKLKPLINN